MNRGHGIALALKRKRLRILHESENREAALILISNLCSNESKLLTRDNVCTAQTKDGRGFHGVLE